MRARNKIIADHLWAILLCVLVAIVSSVAGAQPRTPDEVAALDKTAFALYQRVMSPFCPGRALSDCPSSKAHDLKSEMRQKLEAGTPAEVVLEEVFAKYGDEYRAVPGFSGFALLAWLAPLAFLCGGLILALRLASVRRSRAPVPSSEVDSEISESLQKEIDEELSRIE